MLESEEQIFTIDSGIWNPLKKNSHKRTSDHVRTSMVTCEQELLIASAACLSVVCFCQNVNKISYIYISCLQFSPNLRVKLTNDSSHTLKILHVLNQEINILSKRPPLKCTQNRWIGFSHLSMSFSFFHHNFFWTSSHCIHNFCDYFFF